MLRKIAQGISESAREATGQDVLITDENGIIIGCSMKKMTGSIYEPSIRVIRENKPCAAGMNEEKGIGFRTGATLPVRFKDKVTGSVSITGIPEEAARYGVLVQKQLETMLREQAFLESALLREHALNSLFECISSYDGSQRMGNMIGAQARELGVNLSGCRAALLLEIKEWERKTFASACRAACDELRRAFSSRRCVICPQSGGRFFILIMRRRPVSDEDINEQVKKTAEAIIKNLNETGITADIAVGLPGEDLKGIAASLRSAKEAMRLAGQMGISGVFSAGDFTAETLLSLLPGEKREEFADRTLAALLVRNDYEEMRDTFLGWCKAPFAGKEVAEKLSLHRNSLQYRLKKIRALTGKDPWNFKDAFELWAAFVLKSISCEKKENSRRHSRYRARNTDTHGAAQDTTAQGGTRR